MEPSDLDLVTRHRAGDPKAFEELVRRYQRKVFSLALGVLHHPDDAMDVAQEAFVKVHRYIDRFEGSASFYTWLYRIVVNLCIDHLRKAGRAHAVEYDDGIDRSDGVLSADAIVPSQIGTNPARALQDKQTMEAIQAGLATLSPNHRAVLVMREIDGLSYKEMSKIMKCSKGTIMSRLFHARKRLQAYLIKALNEGEASDV